MIRSQPHHIPSPEGLWHFHRFPSTESSNISSYFFVSQDSAASMYFCIVSRPDFCSFRLLTSMEPKPLLEIPNVIYLFLTGLLGFWLSLIMSLISNTIWTPIDGKLGINNQWHAMSLWLNYHLWLLGMKGLLKARLWEAEWQLYLFIVGLLTTMTEEGR